MCGDGWHDLAAKNIKEFAIADALGQSISHITIGAASLLCRKVVVISHGKKPPPLEQLETVYWREYVTGGRFGHVCQLGIM